MHADVNTLINGYAKYYKKNKIILELGLISADDQEYGGFGGGDSDESGGSGNGGNYIGDYGNGGAKISYIKRGRGSFIFITGKLPEPYQYYSLNYFNDVSDNFTDMRKIQNILLAICIAFSTATAFALYFILSGLFKPLRDVAKASREIAGGRYGGRIRVKGNSEISAMACDFNRMAEEIERQIKALEDEAEQKQRFVDNFAHEIRTPLTSIYGYAEYMQKASLDEREVVESANVIMDEALHMKNVANSLLELTTLRRYTPVKNKISVSKLFDDINQAMRKSLDEKNVLFICRINADILKAQEDLIKSLLINLIDNALKSCRPNEGVIRLEAEGCGGNVILSVSDNGCGIPEKCLASVAEPFYRVDGARSRKHGGAGLGLTLCMQIAEAHNAEMTIESAVDFGTSVKITFTSQ